MGGYITTTKQFTMKDDYADTNSYHQATIDISVDDGGKLSWTVTMNHWGDVTATYRYVSLYLSIAGTDVITGQYYQNKTGFPTNNDSTNSGSLTVSGDTVSVKGYICCEQFASYTSNKGRINSETGFLDTSFARSKWTEGKAGNPTLSQTSGSNTYKLTGSYTPDTNNKLTGITVYWTDDGTEPGENNIKSSSNSKTGYYATSVEGETMQQYILSVNSSSSTWSTVAFDVPSTKASSTVRAKLVAMFEKNTVYVPSSGYLTLSPDLKRYSDAAASPSIKVSGITSTALNKFNITATNGEGGWNNRLKTSTINYTLNGTSKSASGLSTTAKASVSTGTIDASSYKDADSLVIKASLTNTFEWGSTTDKMTGKSGTATKTFGKIGAPSITITDTGRNSFTITGVNAIDGTNNEVASKSFSRGYDTSCSTSFDIVNGESQTFNINPPTDKSTTSVNLYAKAVATPTAFGNTITTYANGATTNKPVSIKYYVAPTAPSNIEITSTKSKLVPKAGWKFRWTTGDTYSLELLTFEKKLVLYSSYTYRQSYFHNSGTF